MYDYICYTKQGHWTFYADSDIDAMRLALYYCWRYGEDFISVKCGNFPNEVTLRICRIDDTDSIQTL